MLPYLLVAAVLVVGLLVYIGSYCAFRQRVDARSFTMNYPDNVVGRWFRVFHAPIRRLDRWYFLEVFDTPASKRPENFPGPSQ